MRHKGLTVLLILCLLCLSSAALFACVSEPEMSQTLLIYMCGSDLESRHGYASDNIADMLEAQLPHNVNVVIQTGGANSWRREEISASEIGRYELRHGKLIKKDTRPLASMGDAETLAYDEAQMQADIEEYGLYTYEELNALCPVSEELFEAVNGEYLKAMEAWRASAEALIGAVLADGEKEFAPAMKVSSGVDCRNSEDLEKDFAASGACPENYPVFRTLRERLEAVRRKVSACQNRWGC